MSTVFKVLALLFVIGLVSIVLRVILVGAETVVKCLPLILVGLFFVWLNRRK